MNIIFIQIYMINYISFNVGVILMHKSLLICFFAKLSYKTHSI